MTSFAPKLAYNNVYLLRVVFMLESTFSASIKDFFLPRAPPTRPTGPNKTFPTTAFPTLNPFFACQLSSIILFRHTLDTF